MEGFFCGYSGNWEQARPVSSVAIIRKPINVIIGWIYEPTYLGLCPLGVPLLCWQHIKEEDKTKKESIKESGAGNLYKKIDCIRSIK